MLAWPQERALAPPVEPPRPPKPPPRPPAEEPGPRIACTFAFERPEREPDPPPWSARVVGDDLVHAAYSIERALRELA